MAKNEIKVNITAQTTQFERNIASLRKKISEAFLTPSQFSLGAISPWKLASDVIVKAGQAVIDSMRNWRKGLDDISSATDKTAKELDASTLSATRLEAAARAASVSAKDYAAALSSIKAGKTSLEQQAEHWERIAGAANTAQARARSFAALIEAERKQQSEDASAAERVTATLRGLSGAGTIAASYLPEISAGRTAPITGREFAGRAASLGIAYQQMGGPETISLAIRALNRAIQEEIDARARAAEKETKSREEAAQKAAELEAKAAAERLKALDAEEAAQKAAMDRVRAANQAEEARRAKVIEAAKAEQAALDQTARRAYDLGNLLQEAYGGDAWAQLRDLFGPDADRLYARGARLIETPEKQAQDLAQQAIERRNARAATRASLEQAQASLEQALSSYKHPLSRPDYITSAGGSLIGSGAYTLQMANRMREIDKADLQREQLAQLKAINDKLRALDE